MSEINKYPQLKKLLLEFEQTGAFPDYYEFKQELEKALKDDWVAVGEDLPEKLVGVLIYIENEDLITVGYLEDDGWTVADDGRYIAEHHITHWRRLPAKPNQ